MVKSICNRVGWSYFLLAGVMLGAVQLLGLVISLVAPQVFDNENTAIILSSISIYVVAMPICWRLLKTIPAKSLYQNSMGGKQWFACLSVAVFIIYVGGIIGSVVSGIVGNHTMFDTTYDLQEILLNENLFLTLAFAVIIGPFLEELFFRKLLIDRVIVFGDKAAIVMSGLMFGLFHGNFQQFFYAFGLGCLFAYIYIRTGKLAYSVSLHMTINFLNGFVEVLLLRKMTLQGMYFDDFMMGNTITFLMENMQIVGWLILFGLVMIVLFLVGLVNFVDKIRHLELRPGEHSMSLSGLFGQMFRTSGFWLYVVITVVMFIMNMLPA